MIDQALAPVGEGLAQGLAFAFMVMLGIALFGSAVVMYIAYRIAGWNGVLLTIMVLAATYGVNQYRYLYKQCMEPPRRNGINADGCRNLGARCAKIGLPAMPCRNGPTARM